MIRLGLVLLVLAVPASVRAQEGPALGYRLPASLGAPADTLELPPPRDPWLGRDKAFHAGASFGLTLGAHVVLTEAVGMEADAAIPFAAGVALGAGLAKEYADERRTRQPFFSWRDLAADALGVGLAVVVVSL
ncbi:MAG: hypothetical protein AAF791_09675 [Bacteroidota bacterium]